MPHLKEILNAYRVNSEKTYVLDLENMAILSQADELAGGQAYGVISFYFLVKTDD